MMKIIFDQNVIIDFLGKRNNHVATATLAGLCEKKNVKGYIAAHEAVSLVAFLNDNNISGKKNEQILNGLFDLFSSAPLTEKIMKNAFNSSIKSYEHAIVEQIALAEKIDYIVTDEISIYKKGKVKTLTPAEALLLSEKKK